MLSKLCNLITEVNILWEHFTVCTYLILFGNTKIERNLISLLMYNFYIRIIFKGMLVDNNTFFNTCVV